MRSYTTGEDALSGISKPTDLWVIDIMLPDLDSSAFLRRSKAAIRTFIQYLSPQGIRI